MHRHKALEALQYGVRALPRHQAEGHLCRCFGWDDGLRAWPGISADNAVDLERRARPELLQEAAIRLACRARQANRLQNARLVVAEAPPLPPLCLGGFD